MAIRTPVSRKGDTFRDAVLRYLFLNQPIAGIGDASGILGSASEGNLYISLHYAIRDSIQGNLSNNRGSAQYGVTSEGAWEYPNPETGTFSSYTSYSRVAVPRDGTNWGISGNRIRNKLDITFPTISTTGGIDPAGVGVNTAESGGLLLYFIPCLIQTMLVQQQFDASGNALGWPSEEPVIRAGDLLIEEV